MAVFSSVIQWHNLIVSKAALKANLGICTDGQTLKVLSLETVWLVWLHFVESESSATRPRDVAQPHHLLSPQELPQHI